MDQTGSATEPGELISVRTGSCFFFHHEGFKHVRALSQRKVRRKLSTTATRPSRHPETTAESNSQISTSSPTCTRHPLTSATSTCVVHPRTWWARRSRSCHQALSQDVYLHALLLPHVSWATPAVVRAHRHSTYGSVVRCQHAQICKHGSRA